MKPVFQISQNSCRATGFKRSERSYFSRNILGEFFFRWLVEERNKVRIHANNPTDIHVWKYAFDE